MCAVLLAGCVLIALLLFKFYRRKVQAEAALQPLSERCRSLEQQLVVLQQDNKAQQDKYISCQAELVRTQSELQHARQQLDGRKAELSQLQGRFDALQAEHSSLTEKMQYLQAQYDGEARLREASEQKEELSRKELEKRLTVLTEQMLKDRGAELASLSTTCLQQTVAPLAAELASFRAFVTDSQNRQSEQSGALRNELARLQQAQFTLSKQAADLTQALSAGGKSQGLWGEHQLELCLDSAGLRQNFEYEREVTSPVAGEKGRPDVVIRLPQNHCIIVDAKCSLTAYSRCMAAEDKKEHEQALKQHVSSVRAHIDELSDKRYEEYTGFNSPSFVFMFVPVDNALTLAFQGDDSLYSYAALKNVYLVSPSSLLPALRTVSNLWMLSSQNERLRRIAAEAQNIYKKLTLVNASFEDVKKRSQALQDSLLQLDTRLMSGKGNLTNMLKNFDSKAPAVLSELTAEPEGPADMPPPRAVRRRISVQEAIPAYVTPEDTESAAD